MLLLGIQIAFVSAEPSLENHMKNKNLMEAWQWRSVLANLQSEWNAEDFAVSPKILLFLKWLS